MSLQVAESPSAKDETAFDLEEFRALRQEIMLKVETTFRLEAFAVTGAAAVYAWIFTQGFARTQLIWYLPVLFPILGLFRSLTLGHQMKIAGKYLMILEERLRPTELPGVHHRPGDQTVHGWEGYLRKTDVWKKYVDRVALGFWVAFILLSIVLPFLPFAIAYKSSK